MANLIWYDQQEGGVDEGELFRLLRTHGFVDGDYRTLSTDERRRVDELAADLFVEITASEVERRYAARMAKRREGRA